VYISSLLVLLKASVIKLHEIHNWCACRNLVLRYIVVIIIDYIFLCFRRKLNVCPILEGEDNVRLLNFQHNLISKIENISQLRRLIFLDFYDNNLECISGLSSLKSLRVLMLGKNRYKFTLFQVRTVSSPQSPLSQ
jgi:hypothetical protein